MIDKINIICIGGQTATGKTAFALEKAKEYNADIINFDSRQLYKYTTIVPGKDIGSSSFTKVFEINVDSIKCDIGYYEVSGAKIWLYDIIDPSVHFTSFHYRECALSLLNYLFNNGQKNIIFVGASYFYLRHLLYNFSSHNIPIDIDLRQSLNNKKITELQDLLPQDILIYMNNSDKNNPYRLIRKIELIKTSNNTLPLNNYLPNIIDEYQYNITYFLFIFELQEKKLDAIKSRVVNRLESGILELKDLLYKYHFTLNDPGLRYSGYIIINDYINGLTTQEDCIDIWLRKELKEAKKQKTAFLANPYFKQNIILI